MGNVEIYRKTLRFSVMRLLVTILGIFIIVALPLATFLVTAGIGEVACAVATFVAFIVGIVVFVLIIRYCGYLFTAAQVAMITEGVSKGTLPDDVYAAGKQAVKRRFVTASVYFALWSITKAITNQITAGLNALGRVADAGNNAGPASTVAGIVSTVISVVLEYLNYCSLGWVFLNADQSPFKSTCDGAVVYFQNWKTLLQNAGKVIGITAVSLVVIGGAFFGLGYLVFGSIPSLTAILADLDASATLDDGSSVPPGTSLIILCAIVTLLLWGGIHSAFVKPFILISVMRRYIEAGLANPPKVDLYGKLAGMSAGFRKALERDKEEAGAAA